MRPVLSIPNIVNVIYSRNVAAKADQFTTRILKIPDAVSVVTV